MLGYVITFYAGAFIGLAVLALLQAAKDDYIEEGFKEEKHICLIQPMKECEDECCYECGGREDCKYKCPYSPKECGHAVRREK